MLRLAAIQFSNFRIIRKIFFFEAKNKSFYFILGQRRHRARCIRSLLLDVLHMEYSKRIQRCLFWWGSGERLYQITDFDGFYRNIIDRFFYSVVDRFLSNVYQRLFYPKLMIISSIVVYKPLWEFERFSFVTQWACVGETIQSSFGGIFRFSRTTLPLTSFRWKDLDEDTSAHTKQSMFSSCKVIKKKRESA